jgi:hypothetical protein
LPSDGAAVFVQSDQAVVAFEVLDTHRERWTSAAGGFDM